MDEEEERHILRFNEGPILPSDSDFDGNVNDEVLVLSSVSGNQCASTNHARVFPKSETNQGVDVRTEYKPEWECIPDVVLIEIYQMMRDRDMVRMSRVCKRWRSLFDEPSLWHERSFIFGGTHSHRNEAERALGFARRQGSNLRRLTVQCLHPTYSTAKKFQSTMTSFLHILNTRHTDNRRCELLELIVTQLHIERYWRFDRLRERLVGSFARFLKRQRRLLDASLNEDMFMVADGLKILEGLGEGSGHCLRTVNMEDFFACRQAIYNVPRYRLLMTSFHALRSLSTNYNYLSTDIIELLAINCERRLQSLSIKVYRYDPHQHQIHPHSWHLLRRACPSLRVAMYFEAVGSFSAITRIATPEVPLKVIQIWTGLYSGDPEWHIGETLKYLADKFGRMLEEGCFYLENEAEDIDESLLYFLERCRQLSTLDLQATLMVPTIDRLCEWQQNFKIGLSRCHVTMDNLTGIEVDQLEGVVDKYRHMLDDRGLDFELLANPGF